MRKQIFNLTKQNKTNEQIKKENKKQGKQNKRRNRKKKTIKTCSNKICNWFSCVWNYLPARSRSIR
jgi:hypothetical protein